MEIRTCPIADVFTSLIDSKPAGGLSRPVPAEKRTSRCRVNLPLDLAGIWQAVSYSGVTETLAPGGFSEVPV